MAFDVLVTTAKEAKWVSVTEIDKYLIGLIPSVPILARGTFEEMFNFNPRFDSTIPELLGLPRLENNIAEGIVIRTNENKFLHKTDKRVILKNKNIEFA